MQYVKLSATLPAIGRQMACIRPVRLLTMRMSFFKDSCLSPLTFSRIMQVSSLAMIQIPPYCTLGRSSHDLLPGRRIGAMGDGPGPTKLPFA